MTKGNKHTKDGNLAAIAFKLLELLHVPVTGKFADDVKLRPEYPSLLAVSNAMHELNVNNIVISISTDQLSEISFPAIAQVRADNGSFIIVLKIENGVVHYLDNQLRHIKTSVNDFAADWTGILLLAETSEKSGEPDYEENRKKELLSRGRYIILIVLSVMIFTTSLLLKPGFVFPMLINALGIGFCVILLMQTFGQYNMLIEAVCKPDSKTDCDQVVNSSMAKIYSDISLAEIGLLFFAGGLFADVLLMLTSRNVFNPYLFFVFILSLPFSFFSVYYQWRIIKTWCPVCLGVMGLLWAGAVYYWLHYSSFQFDQVELISVLTGYSFPVVIWLAIRPLIIQAQSVQSLQKSLYRFSKSPRVFDVLSQQGKLISGDFENAIVLGNPRAVHAITLVTSPTCGPCINAHHEVESWLGQFDENLKVIVRFAIDPKENGSVPNTVARNLISLALNGDYMKVKEAMRTWYNPKRPGLKEWLSSLPAELHPGTEADFVKHHEWCQENNIMAAPTIFFDGRQIPGEYSFKDFENILRLKLNENN